MSVRTYAAVLFSFCTLFLVFFFSGSKKMEQYSGSQTRLGGYLERDYGWNDQQTYFRPSLFVQFGTIEEYTKPVELVVIGDSFSYVDNSWIYFLLQEHKVSVLFMHIDRVSMQQLLANDIFRKNPPRHLVLQSAEGLAFLRFRRIANQLKGFSQNVAILDPGTLAPKLPAQEFKPYQVARSQELTFNERMSITGDYYLKKLRRRLLGDGAMGIVEVQLDCDNCFSSAMKGIFLSESSALDRGAYKLMYRDAAINGLIAMKRTIETNGYTKFHATVFPNKLNMYVGYTEIENNPTIFTPPIPMEDTNFIDLSPGLQNAISTGVRDVYLPNDHHMGSPGFALAAEIIGARLYGAGDQPE